MLLSLGLALLLGPDGFLSLSDGTDAQLRNLLLWEIRLPRVLVAALSGAALAVAGVISQGIFRNPLAGPSIIGTVSGANLMVVLLLFFGISQFNWLAQPLAAFLGAGLSTVLILRFSAHASFSSSASLLLVGFALNAIFAAITTFILSLSMNEYNLSQSIMYWLMGGFNGKGWSHLWIGLPCLVIGLLGALRISRQLDVLNLGEELAQSLSVSVDRLRILSILCISILVAASVAVAGGISFVGLVVPHMTRLLVGPHNRRLSFLSMVNGISLVVLADTAARTLWAPEEIQVGAVLSLVGAPLFIGLLIYSHRESA